MVPVTPKGFDILFALMKANGSVLSKDDLLTAVWPDTFVEEGNLTFNISVLRKVLGAEGGEAGLIQTVPRRGYRLAVEVSEAGEREVRGNKRAVLACSAAVVLILGAAFLYSRSQPAGIQSIAILPLRPIGGGTAPEPLALGLADSIITKLAGLSHLIVRPTAAIARFEKSGDDPIAAGRALAVDAVLTGTIQRTPDRVRVAAQLFSVPDGREIWGDQFDAAARDFFAVEDTISERVAIALRLSLSPTERRAIAKRYTNDPEAHELYITGLHYWLRWNADGTVAARQYFERAIRKDPDYALAYVGLASALGVGSHFGTTTPVEAHRLGRPAVERALQIDPNLAEAHVARAQDALFYEWDGAQTMRQFQEALRLAPNMATTHALYAAALLALGRPDLAERERALQLEPPSPLFTVGVGWSHFYSRDYHLADKFYEEALKKDAGFPAAYWSLGESLEAQRKLPEAIAAFEKAAIMTNRDPRALAGLGHAEGLAGRKREALTIAEELQQRARGMYVPAYFLSLVYLGAGDIDSAMSWLERSADQREDWLVFIHAHPMFDAVRQNPRYRAVEQRVGLWK